MARNSAAGLLTSVDSMFTTQEERDNAQRSYVIDLPAAEISDFPDHPFKVRMDEEMEQMVESVREHGVLSPTLVRPMPDGGYQMVSGHRRKFASELAELPTVPCIVRELTDDEAIIIMVDNTVLKEKGTLQIALRPAVELSYLPENEQNALLEVMESEDCTPSHAQAIKIRDFSEKGKLNPDVILSIMQEEKPNQVEQFKMPRNRIDKFFPAGTPAQKIEDTIVKALEMYRRRERGRER